MIARMEATERGALTLVQLVGVLYVVASMLELGLYWAKCANPRHPVPVEAIPCALKLIPAAIGLVILIKAKAVAEWISNILDD